ncbi:MAG: sigma factor [Balneolales bacterium]
MDQSYDEKQLIEKISDGDVHAFEQVFNTYFHYLHNVAYNRLHSGQAADDIVQDVFTDLWKNRLSLNIHTSLEAYLYQAVKNKVFKYIRYQVVREKEVYINRIRD